MVAIGLMEGSKVPTLRDRRLDRVCRELVARWKGGWLKDGRLDHAVLTMPVYEGNRLTRWGSYGTIDLIKDLAAHLGISVVLWNKDRPDDRQSVLQCITKSPWPFEVREYGKSVAEIVDLCKSQPHTVAHILFDPDLDHFSCMRSKDLVKYCHQASPFIERALADPSKPAKSSEKATFKAKAKSSKAKAKSSKVAKSSKAKQAREAQRAVAEA